MKFPFWPLVALLLATPLVAHAQPDPNNGAKAENPENRPAGANREKAMETFLRRQLEGIGVTETAQQDATMAYLKEEFEARSKVSQKGGKLAQALRGDALTDAQIVGLLNEYQVALEDEKVRRQKAQTKFKAKLDYTKTPKLEAWLVVLGAVGDGQPMMLGNLGGNQRGGNNNRVPKIKEEKQAIKAKKDKDEAAAN